jgi:hypothetical protein
MTFRMPKTAENDVWQCDIMLLFGNATCCFPAIGQSSYVVLPGAQSNPSIKIWAFCCFEIFQASVSIATVYDGDDDIAT